MDKNKIRVAFFGDDFSRQGKGTALVIQKIVEELVERHSDEVEVILLRPEGTCDSPICQKVQHILIRRRYSTLLSYLWFFITHRAQYDCIVFNRMVYPGFWFLRSKKKILVLHDASVSEVYEVPRTTVNHLFEGFFRYVGQYFLDLVIGDTEDARIWISRYFSVPIKKVRTLYLSATDDYRQHSHGERSQLAQKLEELYSLNVPYILDISRFDPHKNILRVLDAFFLFKENDKSPHSLVFVGGRHTPDYSDEVEEKIASSKFRDSGRILNYVKIEDMPTMYACADVLLYPSLVEGFGLPVIEAMKSGTPVITSNVSCLPEVAGGAALLVDPLDPGSK